MERIQTLQTRRQEGCPILHQRCDGGVLSCITMGRSFQRHNRKQGKVQHIITEAGVRIILWERRRGKEREKRTESDSNLTPHFIRQILLHHRGWKIWRIRTSKDDNLRVGIPAVHREGKTAGPQRKKAGGRWKCNSEQHLPPSPSGLRTSCVCPGHLQLPSDTFCSLLKNAHAICTLELLCFLRAAAGSCRMWG